jgi:hypothetical protein
MRGDIWDGKEEGERIEEEEWGKSISKYMQAPTSIEWMRGRRVYEDEEWYEEEGLEGKSISKYI